MDSPEEITDAVVGLSWVFVPGQVSSARMDTIAGCDHCHEASKRHRAFHVR